MGAGSALTADEGHAAEKPKIHWLKGAFVVQSVLLVLILAMTIYVTRRFNDQFKELVLQNVQLNQENIAERNKVWITEKQLKNEQDAFVTAALNQAFLWQQAGDSGRANDAIQNAYFADPGSWYVWRVKSQAMIKEKQAQEALNEMQKAPIDKKDVKNVVTFAMLYCALGQSSTVRELKAQAIKMEPDKAVLADLNSVCP